VAQQPYGGGWQQPSWPVELWYWSAEEVTAQLNRSALITNSPLAAGLFYSVRAAGNAAARRRARNLAEPQWRPAGQGQAVLDYYGIGLHGSWGSMRVEYSEIFSWQHDHGALQLSVIEYYPLMLRSSAPAALIAEFGRLSEGKLWQELAVTAWQPLPHVQVAGWEQRDRRFTCAIPAGWQPVTDHEYLRAAAMDAANNQMRLLFALSRSGYPYVTIDFLQLIGRPELASLAADPGSFERGALRLANLKAYNANGVVVARPVVVMMHGERGVILDTTNVLPHVQVRLREIFVPHRGEWFIVSLSVPHPVHPQALFDELAGEFQTLIATWNWRR
jgi:hypothetical protein